ncbi:MAG: hypothetical protein HY959_04785 [Ignavibacteriae bacterium]|nr:hypothetical protein [Ignavibacteriota bacterium]
MLDNQKLNRRLKRIIKDLKEKWGITPYRIAVESNIPHSSLKYMLDGKFEWKLNHLLSFLDFLNRNNAKVSLEDLLDFENKKSLSEIMDANKADFREVIYAAKDDFKTTKSGKIIRQQKPVDFIYEAENLCNDITDVLKESALFKNTKIIVNIKLTGKSQEYSKEFGFANAKPIK